MFTSSAWGGTASVVSVLRYGGMFGDYELLAEFLDMVVLLCVGVFMAASCRERAFFCPPVFGAHTDRWFLHRFKTFLAGLGVGAAVMVLLMTIRPGFGKQLANFFIVVSILVFVIAALSTLGRFSGYMANFQNTQVGLSDYDTRNTIMGSQLFPYEKYTFYRVWGPK